MEQEIVDHEDHDDNSQSNTGSTPWTPTEIFRLFDFLEQETDEDDQMPCGRRLNEFNWEPISEKMNKPAEECVAQFYLLIKGIGRYQTQMDVMKKADESQLTPQDVVERPGIQTNIETDEDEESFEEGLSSSTQFPSWPIQEMIKLIYAIGPEDDNDGMPLDHRINQINWHLIANKMKKPARECLEQYRFEKLRQEEARKEAREARKEAREARKDARKEVRKEATSKGVTNRTRKQPKIKQVTAETSDDEDNLDDGAQSNSIFTEWTNAELDTLFEAIQQEIDEDAEVLRGREISQSTWELIGKTMKKPVKDCQHQFRFQLIKQGTSNRFQDLVMEAKQKGSPQVRSVVERPGNQTNIEEEIPDPPATDDDEENREEGASSSTIITPWPIEEVNILFYTIGPGIDENDGMPLDHRINQINWYLIGQKMKKPARECLDQYLFQKLIKEEARKEATSKKVTADPETSDDEGNLDDGAQSNSEWTNEEVNALFEAMQQEIYEDDEVLHGREISQSTWELIGKTMKKPAKDCQHQFHFQLMKKGTSNRFQDLLLEAKQKRLSQLVKNPMA